MVEAGDTPGGVFTDSSVCPWQSMNTPSENVAAYAVETECVDLASVVVVAPVWMAGQDADLLVEVARVVPLVLVLLVDRG